MIINDTNLENLRTGFRLDFNKALKGAPTVGSMLAYDVNSTTKVETYGFLGDLPQFRKWVGEKRVKSIGEKAYHLVNDDYEATLGIHKNKIRDDNLGLYPAIFAGWGQNAGQLKDNLIFDALKNGHLRPCFDGQNFFDDEHPMGPNNTATSNMSGDDSGNAWFLVDLSQPLKPLLYQNRQAPVFMMVTNEQDSHVMKTGEFLVGSEARGAAGYTLWQLAHRCTGPLNKANYEAAFAAMQALTDDEGNLLGIKPTHVVHGSTNRAAAKTLFEAQLVAGGDSNIYYKDVAIVEAPKLP